MLMKTSMKKSVFLFVSVLLLAGLFSGCSLLQQKQNPSPEVKPNSPSAVSSEQQKGEHWKEDASLSLSAFGAEPNWDIKIEGDTLMYFNPKDFDGTEDTTNYHLNTIKQEGENIVFEGLYVQGSFEKKTCISDGMGEKMPYSVTLTIKDGDEATTYQGCGEKIAGDVKDETKDESSENEETMHTEKSYFLSAYGTEPYWNIEINHSQVKYSTPGIENGEYYSIKNIQDKGKIIIKGEAWNEKSITATFEKKACITPVGIDIPYTVSVVLKDGDKETTHQGCGEEMLDDFFVKGKTWPYNELAKKAGRELEDEHAEFPSKYTIKGVSSPYFHVIISSEFDGYAEVYKKTQDGYEIVWWGEDVTDQQCERFLEKYPTIVSNPDFPFVICEERAAMSSSENTLNPMTCEEAQIALIKESVEVKDYIEDLEKHIAITDDWVSLHAYEIVLEQSDDETNYFVLKELHKEKDGTERETTTKRFKITKATAVVEEYDIVTDSYNELTPFVDSEEQYEAQKTAYFNACK